MYIYTFAIPSSKALLFSSSISLKCLRYTKNNNFNNDTS